MTCECSTLAQKRFRFATVLATVPEPVYGLTLTADPHVNMCTTLQSRCIAPSHDRLGVIGTTTTTKSTFPPWQPHGTYMVVVTIGPMMKYSCYFQFGLTTASKECLTAPVETTWCTKNSREGRTNGSEPDSRAMPPKNQSTEAPLQRSSRQQQTKRETSNDHAVFRRTVEGV